MMTQASSTQATVTLPSDKEILITREFAAPRQHVYRAYTTPELVRRWWSAGFGEVTVAEIDLRVGGRWRYAMVLEDGQEVGFHGEYHEIVLNERLVNTEIFEGMPGAEGALVTATFVERQGHTTLSLRVRHPNQADRDAHLASGMEAGMQVALHLLEQVARALD